MVFFLKIQEKLQNEATRFKSGNLMNNRKYISPL